MTITAIATSSVLFVVLLLSPPSSQAIIPAVAAETTTKHVVVASSTMDNRRGPRRHPPSPLPRVLISGGGPCGLLASILLSDIGISSIIIERTKGTEEWNDDKSYTLVLNDRGIRSLERAGRECIEYARDVGNGRNFVYLFDGNTGEIRALPKVPGGLGFTRPLLVKCIEGAISSRPNIDIRRGVGVSSVDVAEMDGGDEGDDDDDDGSSSSGSLRVRLEDGTVILASHVIGADGKWSNVRGSIPCLNSMGAMITCPSFGVHMNSASTPKGFNADGTYVINPRRECMFYVIASSRPSSDGGGCSISMVCYDETLMRYPWLDPGLYHDRESEEASWEREHRMSLPSEEGDTDAVVESNDDERTTRSATLSRRLRGMFAEEMPEFHKFLDDDAYRTARVNRRTTWLRMSANTNDADADAASARYSTSDGRVALIGDAAHAMTPSMGEGCNYALESAVRLVDDISAVMKERGETTCGVDAMSEGFVRYGSSRPSECIPAQEESQARNIFRKEV